MTDKSQAYKRVGSVQPHPSGLHPTGGKAEALARTCSEWNEKHPVGTEVIVRLDSGKDFATKTRSGAEITGGTPVIWLEGVRGCYMLDRVKPA